MFQRLEDRIQELCRKAAATSNSPELDEILQDLRAALAEHTRRMRRVAAGFADKVRPERRRTDRPGPKTKSAERSDNDQSEDQGSGKLKQ